MPGIKISQLDHTRTFERDAKNAPIDVQRALKKTLLDLMKYPQPTRLRLHTLKDCINPRIFKIDVFSNKSWQVTFSMDGETAVLRRLARHRDIDRSP